MNLGPCGRCGARGSMPKIVDYRRTTSPSEDDDVDTAEEEEITFKHACAACGHVIAQHFYHFSVDGESQRYLMDCILCGRGVDEVLLRASSPTEVAAGNGRGSELRDAEVPEIAVSSMVSAMDSMMGRARSSMGDAPDGDEDGVSDEWD